MPELWELQQKQQLPLDLKILLTKQRIIEWYDYWDGQVYISFSGGKDSTVLLDLVRSIYPDVPAVFADTGLEYPELREFVKTFENVTWIKPKMNFRKVIEHYGYPAITKEQAKILHELRVTKSDKLRETRMNGNKWGMGKLAQKWHYLMNAPFKISHRCCDVMKKRPMHSYEVKTKRKPYIGSLASESLNRRSAWLIHGCNAYNNTRASSQPLAFWTEQDILEYLVTYKVPYAPVYGEILRKEDGTWYTTGCDRTGCIFCMFGCHLEGEPNRFQRLKLTHPKLYDYCMRDWEDGGLGIAKVLDYIHVPY